MANEKEFSAALWALCLGKDFALFKSFVIVKFLALADRISVFVLTVL